MSLVMSLNYVAKPNIRAATAVKPGFSVGFYVELNNGKNWQIF
jgi:hypothetical protein